MGTMDEEAERDLLIFLLIFAALALLLVGLIGWSLWSLIAWIF